MGAPVVGSTRKSAPRVGKRTRKPEQEVSRWSKSGFLFHLEDGWPQVRRGSLVIKSLVSNWFA
ncbi:hypothetical protein Csa_011690 [Cucumis sativus]|uniref:Uncharacterized protein n=1 Tax=Cucumis sativus TaxID=3659 RepID=A0A0A0L5S6_CUCSA|nr:hypothetical protein Csa_011690 [Cucumis sativus]